MRYYEQEKLIVPARSDANRRRYSEQDLAWAAFILRLKDSGMPIREIGRYARLRAEGDSTLGERMELLIRHREALNGRIAQMRDNLSRLYEKICFYRDALEKQSPAPPDGGGGEGFGETH